MQKLFLPLLIVAAGLCAFTTLRNTVLPIGDALPKADVKMKDISGKMVSLNDIKTRNGLLVIFSCNTCPYVIKYQARANDLCKYAQDKKLGVVVINSNEAYRSSEDSYASMQAYAKAQNYKWYYTVDNNSELANAFDAKRTPECFLFDKEGKLVYHGGIDDNASDAQAVTRQHLKEAITELVAGAAISVKESRSVGCSIKRKA
jgi:thioredoxin-related protein